MTVTFKETPYKLTPRLGEQAVLICRADGNPAPHITWHRHGQQVQVDGLKYKLEADGSLIVEGVGGEDSGDYVCQADNGMDLPARKTFTITILGKHAANLPSIRVKILT